MKRFARCVTAAVLIWLLAGMPALSGQGVTISGQITRVDGSGMETEILVASPLQSFFVTTGADGHYSVTVAPGQTVTITPQNDENPLNGVSTLDLVMIARHVADIELFTSPWQYVAADADNDGLVGLNDSLELRLLILGIYSELPNAPSWRFVPKSYVFPSDPLSVPYPQSVTFDNLTVNQQNVDFFGIKVGDVNFTAITPNTALIHGLATIDANDNCFANTGEPPLVGWIVEAASDTATFTTTVRPNGKYFLNVPYGTYEVRLLKPNALWEVCVDTVPGVVVGNGTPPQVDFATNFAGDCPYLTVDLSTPFLRRCFDNTYTAHYCNVGPTVATDAYVDVALDPYLVFNDASQPGTLLADNTYRFELGDVAPGTCGNIQIDVMVSCEAALGQAHCSNAHIYPDTLCGPLAYTGVDLQVLATCDGEDVVFTITNTGTPMLAPLDYVVIEDVMVQMTGMLSPLGTGESETITVAANGSSWRLEVERPSAYPWSGTASAGLEGCGENGSGTFSLGFITLFPNDEASPAVDVDCQPNVGAYDPNDKQGLPLGVGDEHYVPRGQEIEYMIRFQNTGTDTAFNIVVRDTLSPLLDLATLRIGGASHDFTYSLAGSGVLEFVFAQILLPDSNVNEAASHGYVKFAIRPRAGLPDGAVVENEAAIYFDFNPPVITNRTLHTFGEQYLSVRPTVFEPGLELEVYPNPTAAQATFLLKSPVVRRGTLYVYNSHGRMVASRPFTSNQFDFNAAALPGGLYFYRVDDGQGKPLAGGRLIVAN
jgi:uncharacterized repeat protein (TIGR01451 family)